VQVRGRQMLAEAGENAVVLAPVARIAEYLERRNPDVDEAENSRGIARLPIRRTRFERCGDQVLQRVYERAAQWCSSSCYGSVMKRSSLGRTCTDMLITAGSFAIA